MSRQVNKPNIALLGVGLMGSHMARNLAKAGFSTKIWNRTPQKAQALVADGLIACESAAQAVQDADFVITMLKDGPTVGDVLFKQGVMDAMQKASDTKAGATLLDMSSIKPDEARSHAKMLNDAGLQYLDAPVSGGTKGAQTASLAIMVGGEEKVFEKAVPVFEAMGRPVLVGPLGSGQLSKLANQAIVAIAIGAVAEATMLVQRGGADPAKVRQALKGGFADSLILQQHGARMSERDFEPGGFSISQLKDLNNCLEEARSNGLELPLSEQVRDRFAHFCENLDGANKDHSGLYLELEDRNS